jgi:hypothetical protein
MVWGCECTKQVATEKEYRLGVGEEMTPFRRKRKDCVLRRYKASWRWTNSLQEISNGKWTGDLTWNVGNHCTLIAGTPAKYADRPKYEFVGTEVG